MIIDAHTHILPQRRLDGLSIWLGKVFSKHALAGKHFTEGTVLEELSKGGVKYVFNLVFPMKPSETEGLNLFNYQLSKQFKGVIPFGSLHIENEDKKSIVRRCIKGLGFFGFKLHPYVQGFSPNDEKLFSAYEGMEELGKPLFIHTGFEDYYLDRRVTVTLASIEELLKRFPSLKVIISHMFYPRLNDALYLLETYQNVYADTTNVFSAIRQDEKRGVNREKEREVLMNALGQWSQRMVFGSDHPAGMSDLDTILLDFDSFNLDHDLRRNLLFETAYHLVHHLCNEIQVEKLISNEP